MDSDDLAARVAEDRKNGLAPLMAIGTAGTTAAGAIDPLPGSGEFLPTGELVVARGCRVGREPHPLAASPALPLGIEAADSIACDAHKWFSVPDGRGHVFLPPSRIRARRPFMRRRPTCRRTPSGRFLILYVFRSVVPPLYRPEVVYGAGPTWRIGLHGHD